MFRVCEILVRQLINAVEQRLHIVMSYLQYHLELFTVSKNELSKVLHLVKYSIIALSYLQYSPELHTISPWVIYSLTSTLLSGYDKKCTYIRKGKR